MNELMLSDIVVLCAAIATIYGAYLIVKKPFEKLDDHERRIKHIEKLTAERTTTDRLTLKSLNAIINHMIDGNGIERMRSVRDELQNSIIERHGENDENE